MEKKKRRNLTLRRFSVAEWFLALAKPQRHLCVCAVWKGMLVGRGISLWTCSETNAMSNKRGRRSYLPI